MQYIAGVVAFNPSEFRKLHAEPLYGLQSMRSSSAGQLTSSDLTHTLVQASHPCNLPNPRSSGIDNDTARRIGTSLHSEWEGHPQGPEEAAQSVSCSGPFSQHSAADHNRSIVDWIRE